MRRLLLLIPALAVGVLALAAPAALAGGPTSVLITNHGTGAAAAALTGGSTYTELQAILGEWTPAGATATPPRLAESGTQVGLVWLIHDSSPWRIDTVHLAGSQVWVETSIDVSGSDPRAATSTWSQPARADDLVATLTSLGVLGTAADAGGAGDSPGAVAPAAAPDPGSAPAGSGVPWLLGAALVVGGGLLGAMLTALVVRGRRPGTVTDDLALAPRPV